ncbi:Protein serine/threonine phosphatase PrpC, regulation of stationary phase [hydrothermal vent metagenome]|uniref:Protein serine/threonine phosphatase PrpC, regulation of stationary phase n=1 Tax=hydrothermal vent metagenome TaxID=652676 RepID=A0A3B0Z2M5_9ZZZZ
MGNTNQDTKMFGLFKNNSSTKVFSISHIGDRKENQDSLIHLKSGLSECYLVADGMGGHSGGKLASTKFCTAMSQLFPLYINNIDNIDNIDNNNSQDINNLIDDARLQMCQQVKAENPDLSPHTTAVLVIYDKEYAHIAHAGDSRAYLFQNQALTWQSKDHSIAQLMVDQGDMEETEIPQDQSQNILYRSIECEKKHLINISRFKIGSGDKIILCTDGFWCFVKQQELLDLAQSSKPKKTLKQLTQKAYRRAKGDADNITALLIQFPTT